MILARLLGYRIDHACGMVLVPSFTTAVCHLLAPFEWAFFEAHVGWHFETSHLEEFELVCDQAGIRTRNLGEPPTELAPRRTRYSEDPACRHPVWPGQRCKREECADA